MTYRDIWVEEGLWVEEGARNNIRNSRYANKSGEGRKAAQVQYDTCSCRMCHTWVLVPLLGLAGL